MYQTRIFAFIFSLSKACGSEFVHGCCGCFCAGEPGCARDPRGMQGRWAWLCFCTSGGKAQKPLSRISGPLWRIRMANWILFRVHCELSITARESTGLNRERSEEIREGCGKARKSK